MIIWATIYVNFIVKLNGFMKNEFVHKWWIWIHDLSTVWSQWLKQVTGTTTKKVIGEGHACDRPLRFVTNVAYGDGP